MILSKPVNSFVLFVYDLSRMGYVIHVLLYQKTFLYYESSEWA